MSDPYVVAGHIRRALCTIREHYDAALTPPRVSDHNGGRYPAASGEPVDLHAADVRRETARDLAYWCRYVLDEVNHGNIRTIVRARDIAQMTRFIDTWALNLAEQLPLDADNCHREMTRNARNLEALARGWRTKRIEIGPCPETIIIMVGDLEETTRCAGTLWAEMREDDNGMLPMSVRCDTQPHAWTPWQWRDLGRRLGQSIA